MKAETLAADLLGKGSFDVELLARFDIVPFERLGPDHFRSLGDLPAWFAELLGGAMMGASELRFAANFPYLENFLVDAENFWASHDGETLRSGAWTERDARQGEHHFEAFAIHADSERLLLIERLGVEFKEKQEFLQQARDRALQIEVRKRGEIILQKAREQLEQRIAERTAELRATNLSLQEEIAQRQLAEEQINYLACHDLLTGLPNRTLFEDRLAYVITQAVRLQQLLAVIVVSLDRFKMINDSLGHQAGDHLIQKVAERLKGCLRDSDTIARLGGAEFALVLTQLDRPDDAVKVAAVVHEALKPAFDFEERELYVTSSIGIALYDSDGDNSSSLMRNASAALNRAKASGGDNFQFYHPKTDAEARKRFVLEGALRKALEREEFLVYYQPRVDLGTDSVAGMEALVRWQHPERGVVAPGEFIDLMEETGLVVPLGEWMLRQACTDTKRWQEAGLGGLRVSVNLAARQFDQPNLLPMIQQILSETGLSPQFLELEITESSAMKNPEAAIPLLRDLMSLGIEIAIDDFGSGYSSLGYLKRFPINVLKIDQSFIKELITEPADAAIVTTIITLAQNLRLQTVAEGVENQDQVRLLRRLGCGQGQGYAFSPALPRQDFEEFVTQKRAPISTIPKDFS